MKAIAPERRILHAAAALAWLLCFLVLFLYQQTCSYSPFTSTHLAAAGIGLLCLAGCYYVVSGYLVPRLLYKKQLIAFIVLLTLTVLVFSNLLQGLAWLWYQATGDLDEKSMSLIWKPFYQIFTAYLPVIFGCTCFIALRLLVDQWKAQTRYMQLQKEKAQTELSFLKAQINPHFLFNSINSIFAHIDKSNALARQIVLKFSEMLRYQLYECNNEKIPFEKELAYLNNYIELQRLRKNENLSVSLETAGHLNGFEIAPLLVIPFVENAFKFVSSHDDGENAIHLLLANANGSFSFRCINTKEPLPHKKPNGGGIGIANVQRRLELLYPKGYRLQINDTEKTFEVNLEIAL